MPKSAKSASGGLSSGLRKAIAGYDRARHGIHNLRREDVIAQPDIYLDAISILPPLFYDEVGSVWVCSGYDESVQILNNHRLFSSVRVHLPDGAEEKGEQPSVIAQMLSTQMLFVDPPQHTRLRQALGDQFTPAKVRERGQALEKMAAGALGRLSADGDIDLIGDFAEPLATQLITYLLGMEERAGEIRRWADAYETLLGSLSALQYVRDDEIITAIGEALGGLRTAAKDRLDHPQDDLISQLATGLCGSPDHPCGTALDDLEQNLDLVAANALVLVAGGYQTLTHLISRGLLLLAQNPAQLARLRSDPDLINPVIDEVMRLDGSSQYVGRRATADVDVGDVQIHDGETVLVLLAAANLDERRFPNPRTFDLTRKQGKHLGFGSGAHYCAGAPFAKELAGLAITGFLDRYPEYSASATHESLTWGPHYNTRCAATAYVHIRDEAERAASIHQATTVWNDSDVPLGPARCWHHVFEQAVRLCPEATAVEYEGTPYTYAEIDERSNAVAWLLRDRGVGPESVVAVNMERSVAPVIAVLGIAKAGAAFMLTEEKCPPERLRIMLEEARVHLVIGDEATAGRLGALGISAEVITLGLAQADSAPVTGVGPGNTAFVVFTSGTTGRPKGIANTHEALATLHVAQRRVFGTGPGDRVVLALSLNFDGCISEMVLALLSGAALVIGKPKRMMTGPPLTRFLRAERITAAIMTPTMWSIVPCDPLPDLRIAAFAGERLAARLAERWMAPGRRILNLYGPAEAGIWATWHECTAPGAGDPPIGRPVANKHVYVMDEAGRPLPAGCEGELYIGGKGIGRYIRRNDLMTERFIRDPFSSEPECVLYKTGDICAWREDGVLEYRGRRDRQVKVRGQRVEIEEVERVLRAAPGVGVCSVLELEGRLTALVIPDGEWNEVSVCGYLKERLHSGMVPEHFAVVDRLDTALGGKCGLLLEAARAAVPDGRAAGSGQGLPLTSAGEITKPGPATPARADEDGQDKTITRLTWRVARLFASALRIPQVQVKFDSDFFDLDGDSLAMAELLARLEDEFEVSANAEDLLEDPTPGGIATELWRSRNLCEARSDVCQHGEPDGT